MTNHKKTIKQHVVKAACAHAPCLMLAVGSGVVLPHLAPNILVHNLALEIPLTMAGVVTGEIVGHKLFHREQRLSDHFSSLARPVSALKLLTYSAASIAIHLAVFSGAHLHGDEIHLHKHKQGPNFAPYLQRD